MTDLVQPIYSGYGWSLRCKIGYGLNICLIIEENLSKWEVKMTYVERRMLVTNIL